MKMAMSVDGDDIPSEVNDIEFPPGLVINEQKQMKDTI